MKKLFFASTENTVNWPQKDVGLANKLWNLLKLF